MEGTVSKNEVTHPTKLSADTKIRQLICLATQAATNITSFFSAKFSSRAPPWLRAACKIGSDSPRGHVSSLWAGLSAAAAFHWNFPAGSPGEAGRETPRQSQGSPAKEARRRLSGFHSVFLQDVWFDFFRAGTEQLVPSVDWGARVVIIFWVCTCMEHPDATFSDGGRNSHSCCRYLF